MRKEDEQCEISRLTNRCGPWENAREIRYENTVRFLALVKRWKLIVAGFPFYNFWIRISRVREQKLVTHFPML